MDYVAMPINNVSYKDLTTCVMHIIVSMTILISICVNTT